MPPRGVKKEEAKTDVLYPFVSVAVCGDPGKTGMPVEKAKALAEAFGAFSSPPISYNPPLTAADIAVLFGLETETPDGPKFGSDYLFTDVFDRKVRFHKNVRNRPLTMSCVEAREQDILNNKWELNGETLIVGKTGIVLDGQHTGVALWRAQQRLETEKDMDSKELRWAKNWPDGILKMDKIVVYGIEESDQVVNTINTGKTRTFSDVLYRSPFFASLPARSSDGLSREVAAATTDAAIKQVWLRTALYMEVHSPIRTHSEGVSWLEHHGGVKGKFCNAVKEVMEHTRYAVKVKNPLTGEVEEKTRTDKIKKFVPLGYAACMLWLMGQSGTGGYREEKAPASPVEKYYAMEVRTDKPLDWGYWEKACEFWSEFGRSEGPLKLLTEALEAEDKDWEQEAARGNSVRYQPLSVKDQIVVAAWNLFKEGTKLTRKALEVKYTKPDPETGKVSFLHAATVGGIDFGMGKLKRNPAEGQEPSPEEREEVENGIHELREKTTARLNGTNDDGEVRTEDLPSLLHKQFPDLGLVFTREAKSYSVWGFDADVVGAVVDKQPKKDTRGCVRLMFKPDQFEELAEVLTDQGHTVGVVVEDVGKWELLTTYKPAKKGVKK